MKRSKKTLNSPDAVKTVAGIAWYSSDQWADLRHVVSDPAELESTYEKWQGAIRSGVPDFIDAGIHLVKVPVDVHDLVTWCRQRNKPIDADARAEYVLEELRRRGASHFETIAKPI